MCAVTAALWFSTADAVAALRAIIRATARSSVTLFLLAFTAGALWRFWPNPWTRWQRQNRRYLGVSFAASHLIHLFAILTLRRIALAAMTATSFDRTARALGPRAWTILHTTGSYYVWLIFANSYISRAVMTPEYILPAVLMVAALALRIAARLARARMQQPAAAG